MHQNIYRSIILTVGFALAWVTTLAGNGVHEWAFAALKTGGTFPLIVTTVLSTIIAMIGVFFLTASMVILSNDEHLGDVPSSISVGIVAICFAFVFGAVGALSATGGGLTSAWAFPLLLGFLPMTIAVCELVFEIRAQQLEQKKTKDPS